MKPRYCHHPNRSIRAPATLLGVTLMLSPAAGLAAPPAIYSLGTLGGNSYGRAVNDAGQVAGYSYTTGNLAFHAFRYDGTPGSGGVMRDLGTFGGTYSAGHAINSSGQVAGGSNTTDDDRTHAFRYDGTPGAGGVMHDLGTLGGFDSAGLGINDAGQVAGWRGTRAFRYDGTPGAGGIMHDLGTLGGESVAGGINDAGQVVGRSTTGAWFDHAFLYTGTPGVDGQMIDLDTWLDANNLTEGAKWTLIEASDISNTGWITGAGLYDPDGPGGVAAATRAYLLDASSLVPEPSGLALLAIAVSASLCAPARRAPLRRL